MWIFNLRELVYCWKWVWIWILNLLIFWLIFCEEYDNFNLISNDEECFESYMIWFLNVNNVLLILWNVCDICIK